MNESTGQKPQANSVPVPVPAGEDERRVLRLERTALRVDPPVVRFSARSA